MAQTQNDEFYLSLRKLDAWLEKADWKGYDPFDGLASPLSGPLTLNIPRLRQIWLHVVRRFPFNLRPILGIKPAQSSKAMGYYASGYLKLYQTYGKEEDLKKMKACLKWLIDKPAPGFKGYSWGNHFDGQTRGGCIRKGIPTVVWTSLIGHAFLDAYEEVGDAQYLEVAKSSAEFITNELGWIESNDGICFNYIPSPGGRIVKGESGVHNSNVLGGGFIARVHSFAPNPRYVELARKSMNFTISDQRPDGSWTYGKTGKYGWVDSFHTGYNLESIDWYQRGTQDFSFDENLRRGYKYFIETFFGEDGTPYYYNRKKTPIDIQCSSQGIQTLVLLRRFDPRSVDLAKKVARWTIKHMQDSSGYFYYRKYPLVTNKAPTAHWANGTMLAALAILDNHLKTEGRTQKESVVQSA